MIDVMFDIVERTGKEMALSFLAKRFPLKIEEDIPGELTAFGLSPQQPLTKLLFLSGVKPARLCFAAIMIGDPQVLILDNPTLAWMLRASRLLCMGFGSGMELTTMCTVFDHHWTPARIQPL